MFHGYNPMRPVGLYSFRFLADNRAALNVTNALFKILLAVGQAYGLGILILVR